MPSSRTTTPRTSTVSGNPDSAEPDNAGRGASQRSTDQPSAAAIQHRKMRTFWRHHPLLFALVLVALAFTEYMRWRGFDGHEDAWYVDLAGVLMIGLGIYSLLPSTVEKQVAYNRSPDRVYAWFPAPKTATGVRIMGVFLIVAGAFAALTSLVGV